VKGAQVLGSASIGASGAQEQEHDRLGRLSTILGAPIENVDAAFLSGYLDNPLLKQQVGRLQSIVARLPKHPVEPFKDALRPLLQDSSLLVLPATHSLGILSPSAIEHWQDPVLLRAELLMAAAILVSPHRRAEIYRLPRVEHGAPWQPLLVRRHGASAMLMRVRSDAASNVHNWMDTAFAWADIFPERVRRLQRWPLEGYLEVDQEFAIRDMSWLDGESPEWGHYQSFSWNRSLELKAGMHWLARMVIPRRSAGPEEDILRSYEFPHGVLARLTGWDWALLSVNHRIRMRRRIEYVPDRWRELARKFGLGVGDDRRSAAVVFSRSAVQSSRGIDAYQFKATGYCGGRRIVQLAGQETAHEHNSTDNPFDAERFADLYAHAHCDVSGALLADEVNELFFDANRRASAVNAVAGAMAAAFATESIALWRRLNHDGPFRPMLTFRRPDLGLADSTDDLPARHVDDNLLVAAITNFEPKKHPLGTEWSIGIGEKSGVRVDTMSLFPIWSGDKLFGIIEIADELPGRDASWSALLQPLFDRLALVLPHMGALEHRDLEARRSVRHQIRPALNSLADNTTQILGLAKANRNAANRRALHARSGIHEQIIGDMREFLDGLTPNQAGNARPQSEDPVLDFARKSLASPVTLAVDLLSQIKTAFEGVSPLMEKRGLSLKLPSANQRVHVKIPSQMLQIILTNLASNAAKYAAEDSQIDVTFSRSGKNSLIVEICNLGAKMEENERDLVFHRNFRAWSAENSSTPGEGIGLYHVKGVVSMLGGQVHYTAPQIGARGQAKHTIRIVFPGGFVEEEDLEDCAK
jgi:signal transduction histidine kinase